MFTNFLFVFVFLIIFKQNNTNSLTNHFFTLSVGFTGFINSLKTPVLKTTKNKSETNEEIQKEWEKEIQMGNINKIKQIYQINKNYINLNIHQKSTKLNLLGIALNALDFYFFLVLLNDNKMWKFSKHFGSKNAFGVFENIRWETKHEKIVDFLIKQNIQFPEILLNLSIRRNNFSLMFYILKTIDFDDRLLFQLVDTVYLMVPNTEDEKTTQLEIISFLVKKNEMDYTQIEDFLKEDTTNLPILLHEDVRLENILGIFI